MKQPNEVDYPVVVYLTEPEAHFVSLVKRGANRTPFHIAKCEKETRPMRIIHRIITKKGIAPEAVKKSVGEEASALLKLDSPEESGSFVVYEQHKADAFKADTMEVVSLAEDNSIICLCGELAKKSEGFISKILDKKEDLQGIEVPESCKSAEPEDVKLAFSCSLFSELDAMGSAIQGILCQSSSESTDKAALIRTICDNFLKSLGTAIQATQSDVFKAPEPKEEPKETLKEEKSAKEAKEPEEEGENMNLNLEDKVDETKKSEEESAEGYSKESFDAMKSAFNDVCKQLESMKSELETLKKLPATPVQSHADNPQAQKSEAKKSENVFTGVFGNFSRLR